MSCNIVCMKISAFLFFLFVVNLGYSQEVEVIADKLVFTHGEEITFGVRCVSEQELEIHVFTDEYLALQQKTTLLPGLSSFAIKSAGLPNGKYFILVTGNSIHVEQVIHLKH
jgi:hypothetical protein